MSNPGVKYASIIIAWKASRDQINTMGSDAFARDLGIELHTFYSVDKWSSAMPQSQADRHKKDTNTLDVLRDSDIVDKEMQKLLWEISSSRTDHYADTLEICLGMPVLVRYNEAVEAGITNGAEGHVVGWNARPIGDGKETLDTLFVKLKVTAITVKVPELPDNTVSVAAYTKSIAVKFPDDSKVSVSRTQVPVLLNFSIKGMEVKGGVGPIIPSTHRTAEITSRYTHAYRVQPLGKVMFWQLLSPRD